MIDETYSPKRRDKNPSKRSPSRRKSRSRSRSRSKCSSRSCSRRRSNLHRKRSSSKRRSRRPSRSRRSSMNKLNEPLTIYTIEGCPACKNAKELCDKKGIKYRALPKAGNEQLIKKLTNDYKYVPVIIDNNKKFIGGFQELQKLTS